MHPSTLQLSSLGTLFPGRGLVREQGEAGTEQGKDLGRMEGLVSLNLLQGLGSHQVCAGLFCWRAGG